MLLLFNLNLSLALRCLDFMSVGLHPCLLSYDGLCRDNSERMVVDIKFKYCVGQWQEFIQRSLSCLMSNGV